jgi:hypothetical protein
MGAFTHVSLDRPSRFSDGSYGVWYCGDHVEVALAETANHFDRFLRATLSRSAAVIGVLRPYSLAKPSLV